MSNEGLDIPVATPGAPDAIALLTRIADALDKTGKKAEEAASKTSRWSDAVTKVKDHAQAFNEVREGVSAVVGIITTLASETANLAAEQERLTMMSRRLGLDFDEAAGSAGRFTDEVDVMNTAGAFAARGIRLTQDELNAMTRAAARNAQVTGVETSAALNTLEEALVRGRARGLLPFGQGLADTAAHGYTLREGLAALVAQERSTASATDDARTAAQGLSDAFGDGARSLATMASNALGLPDMIAAITSDVAKLVEQLNEVNRLGAASRRNAQQADDRAPAAAEFAATQRQVSELAARAGISDRTTLALPNINRLTPDQMRELSGRLSVLVRRQTDNAPATADSIANAFRSGSGGGFSAGGHTENDLDRMASTAARAPSPAEQRRAIERAVADARRFAEGAIAANDAAAAGPSDRAARNRSVSAGGAGQRPDMFQQTDETRRASALALAEKERAEGLRYLEEQHRLAASTAAVIAADVARVRAEQTAANDNARGKGAEQSRLNRLAEERSNSSRIRSFFAEQANAAVDLRKTVEDAYGAMTGAAGAHFEALVTGQETAGAALQGFVHDTLSAWAKIAAQQAVIELAAGFASLFVKPAAAPAHFTAAALYGVAAAATGGLAAATAPAAASGSGRASGGGQRAASVSPQRRDNGNGGGTVINVNFGGSIIGAGGARQAAREIANVLNDGARQGGVTLSPRVMGAR